MAQNQKKGSALEQDPLAALMSGKRPNKSAANAPPPLPSKTKKSGKATEKTKTKPGESAGKKAEQKKPVLPKIPPPVLKPSNKTDRKPVSIASASPSDGPTQSNTVSKPTDAKARAHDAPSQISEAADDNSDAKNRRTSRRRPAGPVRGRVAANDDVPSIGGLIYALDQKPSNRAFKYATAASGAWVLVSAVFTWMILSARMSEGATLGQLFSQPETFLAFTAIFVPVMVIWFLALLAWRADELRLRSSTMTEVAVRLAEPDRMAEQSVATLGQAVRRQVGFMNDAVSQALGRAGELEAMVHTEVANLEQSYQENERKIRGLIQELSGERHALMNTSDRVTGTLKELGTDIPALIDKLSGQQIKLAQIIQGAGDNLTTLESSLAGSAEKLETTIGERTEALETTLGSRTESMQVMLEQYTGALGGALENRTDKMQGMLEDYTTALATALGSRTDQIQKAFETSLETIDTSMGTRTDNLQTVFEEYGKALDSALASRAGKLDTKLVERTQALDDAFNSRLQLFDASIQKSTTAIDTAVTERANALTGALSEHAKSFKETITLQANDLDESINHGIMAVRRSSENITRQSLKAIEGLSGQSDLLKNVTENLLTQVNGVTNRFENQGQTIMKAANALETANYKIDTTLQSRHAEITTTLDRLSGKADEFGNIVSGYSSTIEGSITDAETRARAIADELQKGAQTHQQAALQSLQQLKSETAAEGDRALEDLRQRFASVSHEVATHIGALSSRLDQTTEDVRQRAATAAQDIANEQARLKSQLDQIPVATRENTEAMRLALEDQLRALDQLSNLTSREAQQRDISPPASQLGQPAPHTARVAPTPAQQQPTRALSSLSSTLANQMGPTRTAPNAAPTTAAPQTTPANNGANHKDNRWSVGDLLERASFNDESGSSSAGALFDVDVIANALDGSTASVIWARLRMGQKHFMNPSLYSLDGRVAFDDITNRLKTDENMRGAVRQYITDFERVLGSAEQQDPSGKLTEQHITSESGRVYLFLAHTAGRIT